MTLFQSTGNNLLCERARSSVGPSQKGASESDYCFCAYGDAPAALGDGMPWFYWFETRHEMLQFISDHALFLHPPAVKTRKAQTAARKLRLSNQKPMILGSSDSLLMRFLKETLNSCGSVPSRSYVMAINQTPRK